MKLTYYTACGIILTMRIYSVDEAADALAISVRRVRKLLEENRIKGKKLGRDWAVLSLEYTKKVRGRKKKERPKKEEGEEIIKNEYSQFNKYGSWY